MREVASICLAMIMELHRQRDAGGLDGSDAMAGFLPETEPAAHAIGRTPEVPGSQ